MFLKWFQSEITKKAKGNGNTIYQTITSIEINSCTTCRKQLLYLLEISSLQNKFK